MITNQHRRYGDITEVDIGAGIILMYCSDRFTGTIYQANKYT